MTAWAYYNEIDEAAAHVIREQILAGNIMDGEVDTRSIVDVHPVDLIGFRQCHFFAGGGIWSVSARLAGWPDERSLWTGSCPCQGESVAGKRLGADDPRHLWPDFFRLIRACRPPLVVGEQVARAAGTHWLDGVWSDMEGEDYAFRAVDFPACAVDAPHIRHRLYWAGVREGMAESDRCVGGRRADQPEWRPEGRDADRRLGERGVDQVDPYRAGRGELCGTEPVQPEFASAECAGGDARSESVDDATGPRRGPPGSDEMGKTRDASRREGFERRSGDGGGVVHDDALLGRHGIENEAVCAGRIGTQSAGGRNGSYWSGHEWRIGADGKARRVEPGLRLLIDGLPGRVPLLRIAGNAIVAEAGAEVLAALMEAIP